MGIAAFKPGDGIELIRPHQWTKNLLVLMPLFFSGHWSEGALARSLEAFAVFSLAASAGYCLNDVCDLARDRRHPRKRERPLPSGRVAPSVALLLGAVLAVASIAVAASVGEALAEVTVLYLVYQTLYSVLLKHVVIIDLLLLAFAYLLRIFAGVAATGITPSNWILIVTWLTALMLATGKRYLEFVRYRPRNDRAEFRPVLEHYSSAFLRQMMSSTGAALLVSYLLWCNENVVLSRFTALQIFPTAGFVSYGILRYLLLVYRRSFDDDPTRGLLRDPPIVASVVIFLVWIGAIIR